MEIFLDTASVKEIREVLPWGVIKGITTNQKIFLNEKGIDFRSRVFEILSLVDGPLSVELTKTAERDEELIAEADEYSSWNPERIIIKVPMFGDGKGLRIVETLTSRGIKTNMTCLMTTNQVLLAANVGATYASIFFNRIKDHGLDPAKIVLESRRIIEQGGFPTKLIVGSIRKPEDVTEAALAGAHIVTVPYKILVQMPFHPKTEETITEFDRCWEEFKRARNETKVLTS